MRLIELHTIKIYGIRFNKYNRTLSDNCIDKWNSGIKVRDDCGIYYDKVYRNLRSTIIIGNFIL